MTAKNGELLAIAGLFICLLAAPFVLYPVFLMQMLCFALFACAFNLLIGYVGLLSFGHAMFFGLSAYVTAHSVRPNWAFSLAPRRLPCLPSSREHSQSAARASILPW